MTLEEPRRRVRDLPAAEVGCGKAAEVGDTAPLIRPVEPHRSGPLAVDLDDEDAEGVRLRLGPRSRISSLPFAHCGEEWLDVFVGHELDEERRVSRARRIDTFTLRILHADAEEPLTRRECRSHGDEGEARPARR